MLFLYSIVMQLAIIIVPTLAFVLWKQGEPFKEHEKWMAVGISLAIIFLGINFKQFHMSDQVVDYAFFPLVIILLAFGYRYSFALLCLSLLLNLVTQETFLSSEVIMRVCLIFFMYLYLYINKMQTKLPVIQNADVIRMLLYAYLIRIILILLIDHALIDNQTVYSLVILPVSEILMIHFVMKLQQAQREHMQRKQHYAEMEKQKIVSELAASIAHEIRNPITVVKGFLQLISDPNMAIIKEKREQYLDLCLSELERAEYIIKDYLSFSKPAVDRKESILVNTSIDKIASIVHSYSNLNNIDLKVEHNQTKDVKISAHKEKIDQILLNIVKNAIEACTGVTYPVVEIFTERQDNWMQITVKDNGPGMDDSILNNLGSAYQTTKSTGTGLGLMVSKKMIEEMNGKLAIRSSKSSGCRIDIQLPVVE